MIEITYTQEELVPLFAEAERRQKGDKRKDKWGRGYAKNPHLTGLIAEMCFGKWIGKPIDLTPNHDPGYGYAIGGDRIDVKGTDTPGMRGMPAILETNLNTEYLYVFAEVNQGRRLTWLKGCQTFAGTILSRRWAPLTQSPQAKQCSNSRFYTV